MSENVKLVPALCTQCGGQLEVDSSKETAECPFCGATFMVDKAVNNYNVKYAHIEHADNVTIDTKGAMDSILGFAKEQINENRNTKKDNQTQMFSMLFKMMALLMIIGVIMWIVMNVLGWG
ncbi:MAG: hypothetical protein K6G42_00595 [Lachnospiraceae bacterium]|nr:hypothetical protein [Lachnospiraceae bacterium]